MKKRVWTLYRVSSGKQAESVDDIPMQRKASEQFIKRHSDWVLDREFVEVDVSGFKLDSSERNKLVEIMEGAKNKKFEILLVFMFDRIGRRWNDTPQVVEDIVTSGVEVWSVQEGQMKFENHTDRLINYITFWQAGGESLKTSIRTKERLGQLNDEGRYLGGKTPYGYELYNSGVYKTDKEGRKLKELKALRINEEEAQVVKLIFDLVIKKGFGSNRISSYLNNNGYKQRNDNYWLSAYINKILRNPIYKGYKQYAGGEKLQPVNPDYIIIPEDIWENVQNVMNNRKKDKSQPQKSKLLFAGIVRCGYCGKKLYTNYGVKNYEKNDGTLSKYKTAGYVCSHVLNHDPIKHEAIQFGAKKYETKTLKIIKTYVNNINFDKLDSEYYKSKNKNITEIKNRINTIKKTLDEKQKEKKVLQSLRIKIELGESKLSVDYVEEMMINCQEEINKLERSLIYTEEETQKEVDQLKQIKSLKEELFDWDKKFEEADLDQKKVMLSDIIVDLKFSKDQVEIKLKDIIENCSVF